MSDNTHNDNVSLITKIGDPVLAQKARPVTDPLSSQTQQVVDRMFRTMYAEKGVGLAAPQINVSSQIIVIHAEDEKLVLINPKITKRSSDMTVFTEGCLSVPDQELPILRFQEVIVQFLDRNGRKNKITFSGFLAIVCQHEIDHLNGILITDRYDQQESFRKTLNISSHNAL
jgi:peptide deformylase